MCQVTCSRDLKRLSKVLIVAAFLSLLLTKMSLVLAANDQPRTEIQSFPLHVEQNGVDGTLRLLVDSRLTESVRTQLLGNGDWSFVLQPSTELYKEFSAIPPCPAKLEVLDERGRLIAERLLETPLARIEKWSPNQIPGWGFLLTQDFSIGMGSYNGPLTTVLRILKARFIEISSINHDTQKPEPIRLAKTLRAGWRITHYDGATEILAISCHPDNSQNFVIDYARYRFDGTLWVKLTRQAPGMWESDQPFPLRSAFP